MNNPRVVVITGGSDGIGREAARILSKDGYEVVIVGRSPEKTRRVAAELGIKYYICDFAKISSVKQLAENIDKDYPRIDVLANNAGAVFGERSITEDGFEITFQVNHLSPFLLTQLLLPNLIRSSATVIQTSSVAARLFSKLDLADLQNEKHYSPNRAYGDSKLMNILFTKELDRRCHDVGISAVSFHPGNLSTSFGTNTTSWLKWIYATPLKRVLLKPAKNGGEALAWLVNGQPGTTWQPGEYYEGNKIAKKVNRLNTDHQVAKELWDHSVSLLNLEN